MRFGEKLTSLATSLLRVPRPVAEVAVRFATGEGDLVDAVGQIVRIKGQNLIKLLVAAIQRDT